jgi:uncharacterized LabA/DUF88 family protein
MLKMNISDLNNYLFVDGNYLRRAYEDTMRQLFPQEAVSQRTIDFTAIKAAVTASKVFYYDTVDDDAPEAKDRRAFLEDLSSLDGFHIREGTLSRDKKRQKQVDVALAVECLTHAFRKNVWHVSLLAGDLDFKPLVDALVNLGTHVHVIYEPKSGNRKLYRAADVGWRVTIRQFWDWSTRDFQRLYPCPTSSNETYHPRTPLLAVGVWKGRKVERYTQKDGGHVIVSKSDGNNRALLVAGPNAARLEKYFTLMHGEITWQ